MRLGADRRSASRRCLDRGALLFFNGQAGARGCNIVDISDRGARLRAHQLPLLPLTFWLTLDNFVTLQRCQLIWRRGDFIGVTFGT